MDGCNREHAAHGLCYMHYRRWKKHGDPNMSLINREHDGACSVSGCELPYRASGYCDKHYQRVKADGSTDRRRDMSLDERFWSRVEESPTGCWLWRGATDRDGYGTFSVGHGSPLRAHRWSYEAMVAAIPDGLALDHLCFVKSCVNPEHLDPVTNAVNNERRDARLRRLGR